MQPMSVSCTDLAHLLCVTPGRVAQLVQTGIFPRPKVRGQYSVEVYVRIFIQHMRQDRADLVAQRTRWVKAKADKSELELRVRQGELTEVAKVQRQAFAVGRQVRDALQAVPDRVAGIVSAEMDQARCHATLSKEIRQALEALADTSIQGGLSE